ALIDIGGNKGQIAKDRSRYRRCLVVVAADNEMGVGVIAGTDAIWTEPNVDDGDCAAQRIDLLGGQREIFNIQAAVAKSDIATALQRDLTKAASIERNADGTPKIHGSTALFARGSELDGAIDV